MLKNPLYLYSPRDAQIPSNVHHGEYLLDLILSYGDRVALIDVATGESITYKELGQRAVNLSVSLTQIGVKKGQTVALSSENRIEFWVVLVGTLCAGVTLTTVNPTYSKDEMKHVLNISKPAYIFCSPMSYQSHNNVYKSLKFLKTIITFGNERIPSTLSYEELISKNIDPEQFMATPVIGQIDTAFILYSSGTTGLPKGVMLTHYNSLMACNMKGKDPSLAITTLTITPWYHVMGLMGISNGLVVGSRIAFLNKFDEKLYLESIQKYKISSVTVVPPLAVLLSKSKLIDSYDVSSVIIMYSGAAPLDTDTINAVTKRFPNLMSVYQGYGMTESTLAVARDSFDSPKIGSVGKLQDGMVLKIVDIDTGKPLGANKPGEICIKGPLIMKGYIGKDLKDYFDDEGFYKTGDIGYYDEEKYIFIVDRLKELIKYKAYQVPPAEIEAVLLQHPAVADCGVIGKPHKEAGEVPVAFVVKRADVTEEVIKNFVASKLSNPKKLRGGVIFVDQIPKNPTGKILRRELKKKLKTLSKL